MIDIQNISLQFGGKIIFDELSWLITPGSKIGLVGNNGTGKTTLFKAILGQTLLNQGNVYTKKKAAIGYLPQEFINLENINIVDLFKKRCGVSVLEEKMEHHAQKLSQTSHNEHSTTLKEYEKHLLSFEFKDGYNFETKIKQVLKGLAFKETDFLKNCGEFSDGWKMRINLAAVLLSNPQIMLLDEPTNFLDTESLEWLEGFFKSYRGTLIAIVHDRMFLDKVADSIAELAHGKITIYKGNYSYYEKESQRRREATHELMERQIKERARVQTFVDRFRAKATKASQVQSRIKMLDKMQIITEEQGFKKVKIKFPQSERSSRQVIDIENISKSYGSLNVFDNITFSIERGEKIALVGINGAGKSTLLRIISKTEPPSSGKIEFGQKIKLAFFSQEAAAVQNSDSTIWDDINSIDSKCIAQERRNLLGAFLFSGDDIYKKIKVLSGGEKSRLALLKILLKESNFLILDEPTNHLDITTKQIFQDALLGYTETLLIVSHDRHFLDTLASRVLEIRQGKLFNYLGNYSYFIEKRAMDLQPIQKEENAPKKISSYAVQKQEQKAKRQIEKQIKNIEDEITKLEKRQVEIQTAMADPELYKEPDKIKELNQELKAIPDQLNNLYAQWDKVTRQQEMNA